MLAADGSVVPKARTRRAWANWADDAWNRGMDAAYDQEWERQARGEPTSMILLPIHDERIHDAVTQELPAG